MYLIQKSRILLSIILQWVFLNVFSFKFVYRMEFINVLIYFIDIMDLFAQACFLLTIVFQAFDGRETNPGNSI